MYGVSQLVDPSMVLLGWFLSGMGFVHLSCLEFVSLTFFDLDVLVGSGLRFSGFECLLVSLTVFVLR